MIKKAVIITLIAILFSFTVSALSCTEKCEVRGEYCACPSEPLWIIEGREIKVVSSGAEHNVEMIDVTDSADSCGFSIDGNAAWIDVGQTEVSNGVKIKVFGAYVVHEQLQRRDWCKVFISGTIIFLNKEIDYHTNEKPEYNTWGDSNVFEEYSEDEYITVEKSISSEENVTFVSNENFQIRTDTLKLVKLSDKERGEPVTFNISGKEHVAELLEISDRRDCKILLDGQELKVEKGKSAVQTNIGNLRIGFIGSEQLSSSLGELCELFLIETVQELPKEPAEESHKEEQVKEPAPEVQPAEETPEYKPIFWRIIDFFKSLFRR
ncbi:hypothetical protein KY308_04510 [Candidatus Woesearchaeota archaeon]|nr:hypothetical protein [Candidatus Woesearchaeota archaeon]